MTSGENDPHSNRSRPKSLTRQITLYASSSIINVNYVVTHWGWSRWAKSRPLWSTRRRPCSGWASAALRTCCVGRRGRRGTRRRWWSSRARRWARLKGGEILLAHETNSSPSVGGGKYPWSHGYLLEEIPQSTAGIPHRWRSAAWKRCSYGLASMQSRIHIGILSTSTCFIRRAINGPMDLHWHLPQRFCFNVDWIVSRQHESRSLVPPKVWNGRNSSPLAVT